MTGDTFAPRDVVVKVWLRRLRSGAFAQGYEFLHNIETNRYCAFGVLCEVVRDYPISVEPLAISLGRTGGTWATFYDGFARQVPGWITNCLGISDETEHEILELNDEFVVSFSEIADYIEDRWNRREGWWSW